MGQQVSITELKEQIEAAKRGLADMSPVITAADPLFQPVAMPAADFAGFITFNEQNEEQFSFGKYKHQTVASVLKKDPGYYSWIQNADFPLFTKKILTAIRLKHK